MYRLASGGTDAFGLGFLTLSDPDLLSPEDPADVEEDDFIRLPNLPKAWCVKANPYSGTQETQFAVGASQDILIFSDVEGDMDVMQELSVRSDAMDVAWQTRTTVAIAQRNGCVKLWDTRSRGSASRLDGLGFIGDIRCIDSDRILVHGTSDINIYDLRMATRNKPQPMVRCNFDNPKGSPRAFDVSTDLGLIAVADGDDVVNLVALHDGDTLARKALPREEPLTPTPSIRCLKFAKFDQQEDALLGSYDDTIVRWAW